METQPQAYSPYPGLTSELGYPGALMHTLPWHPAGAARQASWSSEVVGSISVLTGEM